MFKTAHRHTIDVLFVITLFAVFALSVIALTGVGANVYENIVNKMDENFNSRTSFSYVYNKIHQSDSDGMIDMGKYEGLDALIISEEIDNITYCTYLYYYDGYLKELFTRSGQSFDPAFGTDILMLDAFSLEKISDSLLKFEITPSNEQSETLFVHLRSVD